MAKQTHSNGTALEKSRPAPQTATALALRQDLEPAIADAFRDGADVQIPAGAEQIVFTPSYTVPIGATVQGVYGGSRVESTQDAETGEVSNFESFLFKNLNGRGMDVWLRGGWNFAQLIKLANTRVGERITMIRNPDKQHPRDPRLRISQFEFYRG